MATGTSPSVNVTGSLRLYNFLRACTLDFTPVILYKPSIVRPELWMQSIQLRTTKGMGTPSRHPLLSTAVARSMPKTG